jgi:polyhydroxyalkanoate synthase subunit PhaC
MWRSSETTCSRSRTTSLAAGKLARCSAWREARSTWRSASARARSASPTTSAKRSVCTACSRRVPTGRSTPSNNRRHSGFPAIVVSSPHRFRLSGFTYPDRSGVTQATEWQESQDSRRCTMSTPTDTKRSDQKGAEDDDARNAADGSPLDVMLSEAALGPVRRMLPGFAGVKLAAQVASRPVDSTRRTLRMTGELGKVALGRSEVGPEKRDRRFREPAWTANPLLRRLMQSYLVGAATLEEILDDSDLSWRDEHRLRFLVDMFVDAVAPSNNPFLNPAAVKAAIDTGGRNYVTGLRQLASDMRSEPRIPSMVDGSDFQLGGNLAVTEGSVVLRTPIFELIQYQPRTSKVREVPMLLVPPMINKYYIADLAPGRSMIEHYVESGQTTFTMSWRDPTSEHRAWNLDAYVRSVLEALDAVEEITGSSRTHVLGLCAGGITSSCAVAHLVAKGEQDRIAGLTLGVTLLDQNRAGTVGAMVDENTARVAIAQSQRKGYLDGKALAGVFAWLRPNDLIWNYWVNNYLLGKKPPAFDVLVWNADTTRMPAGLHKDFIRMSLDNSLTQPGKLTVLGTPVDLDKVEVDSYVVAGQTDHICPWESCYRSVQMLGGQSRFVLSTAGHIAALVNPPDNPKASFRVNEACPDSPEEWAAGAVKHPGSWWTDHVAWLKERSGKEVPAPKKLGSDRHAPLGKAPGAYVLET